LVLVVMVALGLIMVLMGQTQLLAHLQRLLEVEVARVTVVAVVAQMLKVEKHHHLAVAVVEQVVLVDTQWVSPSRAANLIQKARKVEQVARLLHTMMALLVVVKAVLE
jgi:hypothetical protein